MVIYQYHPREGGYPYSLFLQFGMEGSRWICAKIYEPGVMVPCLRGMTAIFDDKTMTKLLPHP